MNAMRLRFLSRIVVPVLVVVVGLIIAIHGSVGAAISNSSTSSNAKPSTAKTSPSTSTSLQGLNLEAIAAPKFTLNDQSGASYTLDGANGHPVALTFVDTACAQECVSVMQKINSAAGQLGADASRIDWVAVSVNPSGDTSSSATSFVAGHGLPHMHFLLGSQNQLEQVWQAYHIAVSPGTNGSPTYTEGVYVLDGHGHERVFLDQGFTPGMLTTDLRALLAGA